MKKAILIIAVAVLFSMPVHSAGIHSGGKAVDMEKLEGITHYGMPIEEIKKKYVKDERVLEIIYSKMRSDDNMDNFVEQFYDDLLRETENWLYNNTLPSRNVRIVISNCKFCKVGFCKRKNKKEVQLVSYLNDKKFKSVAYNHSDIIEKSIRDGLARSAVFILLEK